MKRWQAWAGIMAIVLGTTGRAWAYEAICPIDIIQNYGSGYVYFCDCYEVACDIDGEIDYYFGNVPLSVNCENCFPSYRPTEGGKPSANDRKRFEPYPGMDRAVRPDHRHDTGSNTSHVNPGLDQQFVTVDFGGQEYLAKLFEIMHLQKKPDGSMKLRVVYLALQCTSHPSSVTPVRVTQAKPALDSAYACQGNIRLPGHSTDASVLVLLAK